MSYILDLGVRRRRWVVRARTGLIWAVALALVALLGLRPSRLLLFAVLGVAAGLVLLRRPQLTLVALVLAAFLVPLELGVSSAVSANAVMAAVPLLAALWLVEAARRGRLLFIWSRPMAPLLLLVGVAFLSLLYGNVRWDPAILRPSNLLLVQLGQWAMFALSALTFLLAAQQSLKALRWATIAFAAMGTLMLVGRYGGPVGVWVNRLIGEQALGNGALLVLLPAMTGGQALFNQDLRRGTRAGLLLVALLVPLLGFWRSAGWTTSWLPPLVVLFTLIWLRSRRLAVVALLLFGSIVLLSLPQLLRIFDWEFERQMSVGGRLILWEAVLDLAVRRPLLGYGLTTYHHYLRAVWLPLPSGTIYLQPQVNSHNLYIDLFAQMGVLGLVVFVWLAVEIGLLGRRLRRRFSGSFEGAYVNSALAAFVGILFASGIVEWLIPFVYNVGFRGFRFTALVWMFLGGLVILEKLPMRQRDVPLA